MAAPGSCPAACMGERFPGRWVSGGGVGMGLGKKTEDEKSGVRLVVSSGLPPKEWCNFISLSLFVLDHNRRMLVVTMQSCGEE